MATTPKYRQIIDSMMAEIREMQPNEPFMTDREAIERYGASRITVRRAFAALEKDGYITRQRGRGTVVSPEPGKRVRFVSFMGECLVRNGIEPQLIKGIEEYLLGCHTNLIICNMENEPQRAWQYARRLVETGIDGVILTPMLGESRETAEIAEYLLSQSIPLVLVGRAIDELKGRASEILADQQRGGALLTEHLLSLGHRRIAFFHSIPWSFCSSLRERYQGYRDALTGAGIAHDPALTAMCEATELPLLLKRWLSMTDPPTAIVVDNDITLCRFMETAIANGYSIPSDISMTGFDDIPQIPVPVPHTTVHVPHYEIGRMAASQLMSAAQDPGAAVQATRVPVTLKIRKSTGINARAITH